MSMEDFSENYLLINNELSMMVQNPEHGYIYT